MIRKIFFFILVFVLVFIFGFVLGVRQSGFFWVAPGDDKVVIPSSQECIRSFQEGVTNLKNIKTELGNPTDVNIHEDSDQFFLELYYRTMKNKDAGCTYEFDRTGILRRISLRGSPVA